MFILYIMYYKQGLSADTLEDQQQQHFSPKSLFCCPHCYNEYQMSFVYLDKKNLIKMSEIAVFEENGGMSAWVSLV